MATGTTTTTGLDRPAAISGRGAAAQADARLVTDLQPVGSALIVVSCLLRRAPGRHHGTCWLDRLGLAVCPSAAVKAKAALRASQPVVACATGCLRLGGPEPSSLPPALFPPNLRARRVIILSRRQPGKAAQRCPKVRLMSPTGLVAGRSSVGGHLFDLFCLT